MNDPLVVVPCLNEAGYIENILEFILKEIKGSQSLIVVTDGGSTDGTVSIIQEYEQKYSQIKYLHNPGVLQSAGINRAVEKYAEGYKWFVRIDVHSSYPAGYIKTLLEEAEQHEADSVVVSLLSKGNSEFQKAVAIVQNSLLGNGGSNHRIIDGDGKWIDHGHHALMKITAFLTVGGYDNTFSHNEDAELDYRLTKAGYRIWLTNRTHVVYFPRDNVTSLFKQYKNYGKGRIKTILKHKATPKGRQLLPALIFPACLLALLFPLSLVFLLPMALWLIPTFFTGLVIGLKCRSINKMTRLMLGAPAVIMHYAWSLGFFVEICVLVYRNVISGRA